MVLGACRDEACVSGVCTYRLGYFVSVTLYGTHVGTHHKSHHEEAPFSLVGCGGCGPTGHGTSIVYKSYILKPYRDQLWCLALSIASSEESSRSLAHGDPPTPSTTSVRPCQTDSERVILRGDCRAGWVERVERAERDCTNVLIPVVLEGEAASGAAACPVESRLL